MTTLKQSQEKEEQDQKEKEAEAMRKSKELADKLLSSLAAKTNR